MNILSSGLIELIGILLSTRHDMLRKEERRG